MEELKKTGKEFRITNVVVTERINQDIIVSCNDNGEVSDGFHTMEELYEHRMALNVFLFKMMWRLDVQVRGLILSEQHPLIMRSKFHNDGTMFEGLFIVFAHTNAGDISYHYKLEYWDRFQIPEVPKIPFPYDGHTSQDVIERLLKL